MNKEPSDRLLGLRYGTVLVRDYEPGWAAIYVDLAAQLRANLSPWVQSLEHVGSTAVPGLAAKPIIDIAAGLTSEAADRHEPMAAALAVLGWQFRGDKGDDGGLLFVMESEPQIRVAHLHAVPYGRVRWSEYLAFRDLLIADPDARDQYQHLKGRLAAQFPRDRAAYTIEPPRLFWRL